MLSLRSYVANFRQTFIRQLVRRSVLRIHMGNIAVDIFHPAYWQGFEKLTQDIVKTKWKDDYAERHGREGQAQGGIDVYVDFLNDHPALMYRYYTIPIIKA